MNLRLAPLLVVLALGCETAAPPRPQALVLVDTDLDSPALADRLRIEVLSGEEGAWELACESCSREVVIESSLEWPRSFGVEAPVDGSRRWVRAMLFPAGRIAMGQALPETAAEVIAEVTFGEGVTAQEVFLASDCMGVVANHESALSCIGGALAPVEAAPVRDPDAPSRVGTYNLAATETCASEPNADSGYFDDEVCIEGGTYWMGDVRRQGFGGHVDGVPEHLVTVSSFFLDRHEYTVLRYLAAVERGFAPSAAPPGGTGLHEQCTLNGDPAFDAYPLNCLRPYLAEELCAFEGKRLPTEAEWEWVAGSGRRELLFPWGNLRDARHTVRDGLLPVGSRDFDQTTLEGVLDMGWNVIEWLADDFQPYTDHCWEPGRYGIDPMCVRVEGDRDHGRATRGSSWLGWGDAIAVHRAMAPTRQAFPEGFAAPWVGFRCARDTDR